MINKIGLNVAVVDGDSKKVDKRNEELKKVLNESSYISATEKENNGKKKEDVKPVVTSYRALWVIDEKNNVLIRIEDEEGNLIRQIPPEEIVKLKEKMGELIKNYFKIEG